MAVPANGYTLGCPKLIDHQTLVIKHLAFDLKATPYLGSLGKWAQQNGLAADPKESECVYACQCRTEMPMFIGICDRTEIPRQVLQAMDGRVKKHNNSRSASPLRSFGNLSLLRTSAAFRDNWADIATLGVVTPNSDKSLRAELDRHQTESKDAPMEVPVFCEVISKGKNKADETRREDCVFG